MPKPWRAQQPTCRHGHPFPANLFHDNNGYARCRACNRAHYRIYNRTRRQHTQRQRSYIPVTPDEVAIDRAVMGDPPTRLTPRERAAAVHRLDAQGLSARQIAEQVGCTQRTVHRIRNRTAAA
ncbi:helix-turn-helix domain-containing protein [Streptomyces sp. NPDC056488]|uniref:helix-turn-helix domain-containing protein n=1 Tax=Streptomyces sp. NPDC056488 TaxID=3345836 RepID=UPI003690132F